MTQKKKSAVKTATQGKARKVSEDPRATRSTSTEGLEGAMKALELALDKKALEPVLLDVRDLCSFCNYQLVLSGRSDRQVDAIADGIAAGLKQEDLNFVPIGTGAQAIAAVKAGRVDAFSFADPENPKLVADGDAVFLIDLTDEQTHKRLIGDTYLNNQIMVSSDYARANPEVVQGFVNAIQRGLNWANSHSPEEVANLIKGYAGFEAMEADLLLLSLRRQASAVPKSAVITKDAYDNAMKFPVAIGVIPAPLPYEQLVNTQFAEKAAQQYPPGSR